MCRAGAALCLDLLDYREKIVRTFWNVVHSDIKTVFCQP
jgi:hypothetical protein